MRVLVRLRNRRRDERGAVAIVVAAATVMIFVLAAFAVDFGRAYSVKREVQTATDAAALGAAGTYTKIPGICDVLNTPTNKTVAQAAANKYMTENFSGFPENTDVPMTVTCVSGKLVVHVSWEDSIGTTFGQVAGVDTIDIGDLVAEATVDIAPEGAGTRPLAVCSDDLVDKPIGSFINLYKPGSGHRPPGTCPMTDDHGSPAAWWGIDCPEEITMAANGDSTSTLLAQQIANGCQEDVVIVPGQTPTMSKTELSTLLTSYCPTAATHRESCLSSHNGNADSNPTNTAWQSLITNQTQVVLPVFCSASGCDPSTITGQGTGAILPVRSLVAVQVCGYHWTDHPANKKFPTASTIPSGCVGMPPVWSDPDPEPYLTVKLIELPNGGALSENDCQLGTACDTGHRRVRLTK